MDYNMFIIAFFSCKVGHVSFWLSFLTHLSSSRLRRISSSSSLWIQVPSLLIFSKCFFTSSLHSACNLDGHSQKADNSLPDTKGIR